MAGNWEDGSRVATGREVSSEAFMEELCTNSGGYGRFFWTLLRHYLGWWLGVVAVPALFLDHHRCESKQGWFAWLLYAAVVLAMLALAILLELSVVQRLGLLKADEIPGIWTDNRWQMPLLKTALWKLDSYTDVVFIFIAKDCDSSLWWASLATFVFGIVFGQLLFNVCFACSDCDHELPKSFGFMLLDFKLVNSAVHGVLPFDPDASHLPVARPVTIRGASHLVGMEKIVGDVAQVSIQSLFLGTARSAHGFVIFSVICGALHGGLSLTVLLRECWQDEVEMQSTGIMQGTALQPLAPPQSISWPAGGSAASPLASAGSSAAGGYSSVVQPSVLGRSAPSATAATASSTAAPSAIGASRRHIGARGFADGDGGLESGRRESEEAPFDPNIPISSVPKGGAPDILDLL